MEVDDKSPENNLRLKEIMKLEHDDLGEEDERPLLTENQEDNYLITKFQQEHGVKPDLQPPKLEEFMTPSPGGKVEEVKQAPQESPFFKQPDGEQKPEVVMEETKEDAESIQDSDEDWFQNSEEDFQPLTLEGFEKEQQVN